MSCEFTGASTFTNVMPTTSPLLGEDLVKASIDTISASTAFRVGGGGDQNKYLRYLTSKPQKVLHINAILNTSSAN